MKRLHETPAAAHTHQRNRYGSEKPDFAALAASYPTFARYVTLDHSVVPAKATLDWKAPGAVVALTQSLLHRDFGLAWELPPGRLCPGITCRANYIHWVEDLLALRSGGARGAAAPRGVDIGTGGSCIFPLMGHAMHGWTFVATDIDPVALEAAQRNVNRNGLQLAVSLRLVRREDCVLRDVVEQSDSAFDFCMCNPPFFASITAVDPNPFGSCQGVATELVTAGGEVAFVGRMIEESVSVARVRCDPRLPLLHFVYISCDSCSQLLLLIELAPSPTKQNISLTRPTRRSACDGLRQ